MKTCPMALALMATALMSACAGSLPSPAPHVDHRLAVMPVADEYWIAFRAGERRLDERQVRDLHAFIASRPPGVPEISLVAHSASSRVGLDPHGLVEARLAAVATTIGAVRPVGMTPSVIAGPLSGRARLIAGNDVEDGIVVQVQSRQLTVTDCEQELDDAEAWIGCASLFDLARMIETPSDVEWGRLLGWPDAVHQSDGVVRYRTDKVKPLDGGTLVP